MRSLVTRVLVAAGAVLVVFLGLTIFALDTAFKNAAFRAVHDRLQVQVLALISAARLDDDGLLQMPEQLPEPRLHNPGSGLYAQILDHNGETVWRSPSTAGVALRGPDALDPGQEWFGTSTTTDGVGVFQLGLTVLWDDSDDLVDARVYHFKVGEVRAPYRDQLARYRATLFWWFGLLFAALIAAQLVILRRTLRPLRELAAEVAAVESGERETVGSGYPRELQRLARNLNALIRNERGHLRRYRHTLGDLAHSLKTPLAVVRCALEEAPNEARDETIVQQVERMDDIVRFQLQRSLAAGSETFGRAFPVAPELDLVIGSLTKVYADKGLRFDIAADADAVFRGDRAALLEVLGNLLDNACKWARREVEVRVHSDGDGFVLTVADDGPGIPAAARDEVLNRGIRHDETIAGHGIGLAVVNDIVTSRGGRLTLGDSARLGGLEVSLRL